MLATEHTIRDLLLFGHVDTYLHNPSAYTPFKKVPKTEMMKELPAQYDPADVFVQLLNLLQPLSPLIPPILSQRMDEYCKY